MSTTPKILLFQGDSITDSGRSRDAALPPNRNLGMGYPLLLAAQLLQHYPHTNLHIYNRGVGGNRITDLYARWKGDALNLQPQIISILIGVNDSWHEAHHRTGTSVERYADLYRILLEDTVAALPDVKLVLCEPFVLGTDTEKAAWSGELRERSAVVADLATRFKAFFVPLQEPLNAATQTAPADYWLYDGVHPTPAGHALIAAQWFKVARHLFDGNRPTQGE